MNKDNQKYSAVVNGESIESIKSSLEGYYINDRLYIWEISFLPDGRLHVIKGHKNFIIQILERDEKNKFFLLKINNQYFKVKLNDSFDHLLKKMGMNEGTGILHEKLQAPMPGQIVEIRIKEGACVSPGDPLVVLKAMKMENILKATSDAIIKKILVKEGDAVEKNQDLILF